MKSFLMAPYGIRSHSISPIIIIHTEYAVFSQHIKENLKPFHTEKDHTGSIKQKRRETIHDIYDIFCKTKKAP